MLSTGVRIRHTVVAHAAADTVLVESRIANLGATAIDVQRLCYPFVYSPKVSAPYGKFGPACYSMGTTIASNDSLSIASDGIIFGQPGHYRFQVHALDPAETDAYLELELVAFKPGRHMVPNER